MRIEIDVEEFLHGFGCWFRGWVVQQRLRQREAEIREMRREILVFAPKVGEPFTTDWMIQDLTRVTGKEPSPAIVQDALASLQRAGVVAVTDHGDWYMTGN
jgi:hypothetical protein